MSKSDKGGASPHVVEHHQRVPACVSARGRFQLVSGGFDGAYNDVGDTNWSFRTYKSILLMHHKLIGSHPRPPTARSPPAHMPWPQRPCGARHRSAVAWQQLRFCAALPPTPQSFAYSDVTLKSDRNLSPCFHLHAFAEF